MLTADLKLQGQRTLVFLVAFSFVISLCFCQGKRKLKLYGPATSYDSSRDAFGKETADANINWPYVTEPAECTPIHTSWFFRHGSRNPANFSLINNLHKAVKGSGTNLTQLGLAFWSNPFSVRTEHALNKKGESEMFDLGRNLGEEYQSTFENKSTSDSRITLDQKALFISSSRSWVVKSSLFFIHGMSDVIPVNASFNSVNNRLIRYYDYCEKSKKMRESKDYLDPYTRFLNGLDVLKVVTSLQRKLCAGCGTTIPLSADDAITIYEECAYEDHLSSSSPWCQFLEDEDIRTLAYAADLKKWYQSGPAYDLSWQRSCVLLRDFFDRADQMLGQGYPKAVFRFGHTDGLLGLVSLLGLFKDSSTPGYDNMNLEEKRQWVTTFIVPMAGNLEFTLVNCNPGQSHPSYNSGDKELQEKDVKVRVRVNGRPVQLPMCDQGELCSYRQLKQYFTSQPYFCNFDEICENQTSEASCLLTRSLYLITAFTSALVLFFGDR